MIPKIAALFACLILYGGCYYIAEDENTVRNECWTQLLTGEALAGNSPAAGQADETRGFRVASFSQCMDAADKKFPSKSNIKAGSGRIYFF